MSWGEDAFDALLEARIRQIAFVPDAGLTNLIRACEAEPSMTCFSPAREDDAIGIACGAWLGGDRTAILMQSSGIGNCINAFAMAKSCRMPLLLIVTMRGEWGEANPWQLPMGQMTPDLLKLAGFVTLRLDDETKAAETIEAAATLAFSSLQMTAVLVSQSLIGAKAFKAGMVK